MVRPASEPLFAPDSSLGLADIVVGAGDLVGDPGLRTVVLVSLFTDRRLETTEDEADLDDRRGYWADTPGNRWGSLLWRLERAKMTTETLALAEESVRASLAWLVDEGIASSIEAEASADRDCLSIRIRIVRQPGGRWESQWDATLRESARVGSVSFTLEAA